jgi:1,4-dihydroxy-2-naphthoate octaprenyltransferase
LVIKLGRRKAADIYVLFLMLTYLSLLAGVAFGVLPTWSLLGLLTIPLALPAGAIALKYPDDMKKIQPAMAMNVLINLLTPVLVGVGILIG